MVSKLNLTLSSVFHCTFVSKAFAPVDSTCECLLTTCRQSNVLARICSVSSDHRADCHCTNQIVLLYDRSQCFNKINNIHCLFWQRFFLCPAFAVMPGCVCSTYRTGEATTILPSLGTRESDSCITSWCPYSPQMISVRLASHGKPTQTCCFMMNISTLKW